MPFLWQLTSLQIFYPHSSLWFVKAMLELGDKINQGWGECKGIAQSTILQLAADSLQLAGKYLAANQELLPAASC